MIASQHMPMELLKAAAEGISDAIIPRFGLEDKTGTQATRRSVEFDVHRATNLGNTIAHVLVTNEHTDLAYKVLKKDISLLKAQNAMLETPLHCAAKAGNEALLVRLIQLAREQVTDSLKCVNRHGETALQVAAKHNREGFVRVLMQLDPAMACQVDMKGMSPLHAATARGNTSMAKTLLQGNPSLAYVSGSDGLFPVHVTARAGNVELLIHFIREYPDSSELLDFQDRNIFHYAAQSNKPKVFTEIFETARNDNLVNMTARRMIDAMDEEGNTPLHVAAKMGHQTIMIAISKKQQRDGDSVLVLNNEGQSPFDLSVIQLKRNAVVSEDMQQKIEDYIREKGPYFTPEWFKNGVVKQLTVAVEEEGNQDLINKTQVVGLGSVLIATVTFAAAFAPPGGYNSDTGAPVLGRSYIFKAFILADTLAFMKSFVSVLLLILGGYVGDSDASLLAYAMYVFCSGATCMVVAFGLGLYLVLAPISKAIATMLLVIALLHGSPTIALIIKGGQGVLTSALCRACITFWFLILMYVVPYMFIFFFAFL